MAMGYCLYIIVVYLLHYIAACVLMDFLRQVSLGIDGLPKFAENSCTEINSY